MTWTPAKLPDQSGRTFVITGGNAGIGYFTAEQLAGAGAHVVLAARDLAKAGVAADSIRGQAPGASVDVLQVDLSSMESVRVAGKTLRAYDRIDGLVLNAGMTTGSRRRSESVDGNELTLATNFIGHFALTAGAWPALSRSTSGRVVGLGSLSTLLVPFDVMDLQTRTRHGFFRAYAQSKHSIHAFVLELDRRARAARSSVSAVLAHPGYAVDSLSPFRPGVSEPSTLMRVASSPFGAAAQGKNRGAAPTVRALLDPEVVGGEFVGPAQLTRGRPVLQEPVASSASPESGEAVWALAERWSGVRFVV
jgi:NAD(P)-dependent dehydrogenase (short-subunit alcohol dehydrogenase family)